MGVTECEAPAAEPIPEGKSGLIPLGRAADLLPVPVTFNTLKRWAVIGLRGVKLRTQRVGARWFVREADLTRFLEELAVRQSEKPTFWVKR